MLVLAGSSKSAHNTSTASSNRPGTCHMMAPLRDTQSRSDFHCCILISGALQRLGRSEQLRFGEIFMSPTSIAWIVLLCVFGGALLGTVLRLVLPTHHLSADSKDAIKLAMGLTATMAALVLALLIAAAKSSYDAQRSEITQLSASIVLLDRVLAHYGPETKAARDLLSHTAAGMIDRIWPKENSRAIELSPAATGGENFYDK